VQPAVDHRQAAAAGQGQVVVAGLTEPLHGIEEVGQRGPERRRALFEQGIGGEQQPFGVPLGVSGALRQLRDLSGEVDPFSGAAGTPQHVVAGQQARSQGLRVVERAGQRDRLLGQRPGPRPLGGD
jgi:hypothetical protein